METMTDRLESIAQAIERDGFAYARAPEMRAVLERAGLRDWDRFRCSWYDVGGDAFIAGLGGEAFLAEGGPCRRRRFACFRASPAGISRKPHQPHYQSRDYNPLNGGLERWFGAVIEASATH